MVFEVIPKNFNPKLTVVCCACLYNNRILLLKRNPKKREGNKWGFPGGKPEYGETEIETVIREIKEETGIRLSARKINYKTKLFVRYPELDFNLIFYTHELQKQPTIKLKKEESLDFIWIKPADALNKLPLVKGNDYCLRLICKK